MSKQKLKKRIEEIFLEFNLRDIPLATAYESSADQTTDLKQSEQSESLPRKINPFEPIGIQSDTDANILMEINKSIDLVPYLLNAFGEINGLSNLMIQGIDGTLEDQQLSDITTIKRISDSQRVILKEIEELSRHAKIGEEKNRTSFAIQDLLSQIQHGLSKNDYQSQASIEINCPSGLPNLYADAVFLRRSIIHSLELFTLYNSENGIILDVAKDDSDKNNPIIQFHIHEQKRNKNKKGINPSDSFLKTARLHWFFIEHWIQYIGGQVNLQLDNHNSISSLHINIPILESPKVSTALINENEKPTIICLSQELPSTLLDASKKMDVDFKQIKNRDEMDEMEMHSIQFCFLNLASYKSNWQEMNECIFEIYVINTPIIPIFHSSNLAVSSWFPQIRILLNPIEPNDFIQIIKQICTQYHSNRIWILDKNEYVVRLLKNIQKQFTILTYPLTGQEANAQDGKPVVIINLQLNPDDEKQLELSCIQECISKKIPLILLLPENINPNQAEQMQNIVEAILPEAENISLEQVMNFLLELISISNEL